MDTYQSNEPVDLIVRRVFAIEDITSGGKDFLYRYRGHLVSPDSAAAYDQLAAWLEPYHLTPLFRLENDQQVILLVRSKPAPSPSRPVVNLVMFIITLISVIISGWISSNEPLNTTDPIQVVLKVLQAGWPFAVSLMAILGTHELGHYFAGRAHGVHVTLPFFIPLPFTALGTMGAFISMKDTPKTKRVLMDIGVAGPLAGLVVSVVVMVIGLSLSKLDTLPQVIQQGQAFQIEGNFAALPFAQIPEIWSASASPCQLRRCQPPSLLDSLLLYRIPCPFGWDRCDDPPGRLGRLGWFSGHIIESAARGTTGWRAHLPSPFRHQTMRRLFPVVLVALVVLGFVWNGWWLWAFLVFLFGHGYAEPLDQITPLDGKRKALGVLALIIFIITFTPVPLTFLL